MMNSSRSHTDAVGFINSLSSSGSSSGSADIRELQHRVDKLEIVCEALWQLLKTKTDLEDWELVEKVAEVDLKDGKLDNKKRKEKSFFDCRACGRRNSDKHPRCLYCGEIHVSGPFD